MNANFEDPLNRNLINKNFWSYVKSKSSSHRIPGVVSYGDCIRSDPQGQCDIFNTFFMTNLLGKVIIVLTLITPVTIFSRFLLRLVILKNY